LEFVNFDKAFFNLDLGAFKAEASVKGMRPTATKSISASNFTSSPFEVLPVTTTPVSVFSSFSSLVST